MSGGGHSSPFLLMLLFGHGSGHRGHRRRRAIVYTPAQMARHAKQWRAIGRYVLLPVAVLCVAHCAMQPAPPAACYVWRDVIADRTADLLAAEGPEARRRATIARGRAVIARDGAGC